LAGRKLLQDLEEGRVSYLKGLFDPKTQPTKHAALVDREGARIGIEFGLASKWTSFVAVAADDGKEVAQEQEDVSSSDAKMEMIEGSRSMKKRKSKAGNAYPAPSTTSRSFPSSFSASYSVPPSSGGLFGAYGGGVRSGEVRRSRGVGMSYQMQMQAVQASPPPSSPASLMMMAQGTPAQFHCLEPPQAPGFPPSQQDPPSEGVVVALSKLQKFSGLFQLKPELLAALGSPAQSIAEALSNTVDAGLLATMIVIKILEKKFSDEEEEWELIVQKAMAAAAAQYGSQEVERVGAAIDGIMA
jgi:hypothetical protein